jgi:hypothetical protein
MDLPAADAATLPALPAPLPADHLVYVYAFVDADRLDDLSHLTDAEPSLSLHRVGAIGAIVCYVPATAFSGSDGERNLADPAWLMPRICRHEAVVEKAMQFSPVFPTGFATLYVSLDSLTGQIRRHEAAIAEFLKQVTGQQEWSLKLTARLDDPAALAELATELWPGWSACQPGLRYLRLRQGRPALLQAASKRAAQQFPGIVDRLCDLVTAIRPLVPSAASRAAGEQHIETYALLVPVGHQTALHARVDEFAAGQDSLHLQTALSGPWPPYSFRPSLDVKEGQQDT